MYSLSTGTVSDVFGRRSFIILRKTEKARRTVIPSETFSPDSGGSQNTNRSMIDSRMMGTMMLVMLYRDFLSNIIEYWKMKCTKILYQWSPPGNGTGILVSSHPGYRVNKIGTERVVIQYQRV